MGVLAIKTTLYWDTCFVNNGTWLVVSSNDGVAGIHSAGIYISYEFLKTHLYTVYTYLLGTKYLLYKYKDLV